MESYPEHFTLSQSASEGLMEFQWMQYKEKLKQMTFDVCLSNNYSILNCTVNICMTINCI